MPTKPKPKSAKELEQEEQEKKLSKEGIEQWLKAKETFTTSQTMERTLRAVIATAFGVEGKSKTSKVHGYKVEVQNGTDYSVDKGIMDVLNDILSEAVQGEYPNLETSKEVQDKVDEIIYSVLSFRPELKVTAYRALPENIRAVLEPFITSKPSSPQVKIEPLEEK